MMNYFKVISNEEIKVINYEQITKHWWDRTIIVAVWIMNLTFLLWHNNSLDVYYKSNKFLINVSFSQINLDILLNNKFHVSLSIPTDF